MAYEISKIENAIVDRLKSQISYLGTCTTLSEFMAKSADKITLKYPAVYVVYQGCKYDYRVGFIYKNLSFAVIVLAENLRAKGAARQGDRKQKGVYKIMDDVLLALINHSVGLNIRPLVPVAEQAVEGTETLAVYGIEFKTVDEINLTT